MQRLATTMASRYDNRAAAAHSVQVVWGPCTTVSSTAVQQVATLQTCFDGVDGAQEVHLPVAALRGRGPVRITVKDMDELAHVPLFLALRYASGTQLSLPHALWPSIADALACPPELPTPRGGILDMTRLRGVSVVNLPPVDSSCHHTVVVECTATVVYSCGNVVWSSGAPLSALAETTPIHKPDSPPSEQQDA